MVDTDNSLPKLFICLILAIMPLKCNVLKGQTFSFTERLKILQVYTIPSLVQYFCYFCYFRPETMFTSLWLCFFIRQFLYIRKFASLHTLHCFHKQTLYLSYIFLNVCTFSSSNYIESLPFSRKISSCLLPTK